MGTGMAKVIAATAKEATLNMAFVLLRDRVREG